jgi:2OG-Fe(II) oxygenase superfamily
MLHTQSSPSARWLQSEEEDCQELSVCPWPHLVIDDFLSPAALAQSLLEVSGESYQFETEARGIGRIEYSVLKSVTLWRELYSKRTVSLLSSTFGVGVKLNKQNWMQLRRMNGDTPEFPLHNDFSSNEDTIASFLYLSNGWSAERGGHLYESDKQSMPSISVDPIANRLVAFRTKPSHWHAVEKVCAWERLSVLALWDVVDT